MDFPETPQRYKSKAKTPPTVFKCFSLALPSLDVNPLKTKESQGKRTPRKQRLRNASSTNREDDKLSRKNIGSTKQNRRNGMNESKGNTNSGTRASASSQPVKNTKIPVLLANKNPDDYIARANTYLKKQREDNPDSVLEVSMPGIESPFLMQNEASTVRGLDLYFIHAINQAISVGYGNKICSVSEYVLRDKLRVDQAWKRTELQPWLEPEPREATENEEGVEPEDIPAVALLEAKRKGLIFPDEFEQAAQLLQEASLEFTDRVKKAVDAEKERAERFRTPIITNNAEVFIKQAAAYAIRTNCAYVALCDYDSLILLVFQDMKSPKDKKPGSVGDVAVCTVVRKKEDYRKAMLGFILEAEGRNVGRPPNDNA